MEPYALEWIGGVCVECFIEATSSRPFLSIKKGGLSFVGVLKLRSMAPGFLKTVCFLLLKREGNFKVVMVTSSYSGS